MSRPVDVLLVCSGGGHLLQLWSVRDAWDGYERAWAIASHERSDAASLLANERHTFCYGPTSRSLRNLARNALLAWRLLGRLRPKVVLTTGAAVAVPFLWAARLRGVRTVYVESLARSNRLSLAGRLARPAADRFYVQWPALASRVPGTRYAGTVNARSATARGQTRGASEPDRRERRRPAGKPSHDSPAATEPLLGREGRKAPRPSLTVLGPRGTGSSA